MTPTNLTPERVAEMDEAACDNWLVSLCDPYSRWRAEFVESSRRFSTNDENTAWLVEHFGLSVVREPATVTCVKIEIEHDFDFYHNDALFWLTTPVTLPLADCHLAVRRAALFCLIEQNEEQKT